MDQNSTRSCAAVPAPTSPSSTAEDYLVGEISVYATPQAIASSPPPAQSSPTRELNRTPSQSRQTSVDSSNSSIVRGQVADTLISPEAKAKQGLRSMHVGKGLLRKTSTATLVSASTATLVARSPPMGSAQQSSPKTILEDLSQSADVRSKDYALESDEDSVSSSEECWTDSDSDAATNAAMSVLLQRARAKYADERSNQPRTARSGIEDGADVVRLDESDQDDEGENQEHVGDSRTSLDQTREPHQGSLTDSGLSLPLAVIALPALTSLRKMKPAVQPTNAPAPKSKEPKDRFGALPGPPPLTKSQRRAQKAQGTKGWYELPRQEPTDEVKREIYAMRMHNTMDPKRFYRGGLGKGLKEPIPERFQFGHIIGSGQSASVSVSGKGTGEGAVRKRSFLEALVEDQEAQAWAKKKYVNEVQKRGASGGRGHYKTTKQKRKR